MSEVARRLKIGRSTLYRKLDEAAASAAEPSPAHASLADHALAWNECAAFSLLSMNRCGVVTDQGKERGNARKPLQEMPN
jgi:hypothetical protein